MAGALGAVQVSAKTAGVDVGGNQTAAKSQDEQERERVVQDIQTIYTGAEKGVKDTLGELTDEETNRRFDEVHKAASDAGRPYDAAIAP